MSYIIDIFNASLIRLLYKLILIKFTAKLLRLVKMVKTIFLISKLLFSFCILLVIDDCTWLFSISLTLMSLNWYQLYFSVEYGQ